MDKTGYVVKLVDQITERSESKRLFEEYRDNVGTLMIDNSDYPRAHFILTDGVLHTSPVQDTVIQDDQIIIVTKNSTYVFEVIKP